MFKTPLETALESQLAKRGLVLGDALYLPDLLVGVEADALLERRELKKNQSVLAYEATINANIVSDSIRSARRRVVEINELKIVHDLCLPYKVIQSVPESLIDCVLQSALMKRSGKNVCEYVQYYAKSVGAVPWIFQDAVVEVPCLIASRPYSEPVDVIAEHILDYADLLRDA